MNLKAILSVTFSLERSLGLLSVRGYRLAAKLVEPKVYRCGSYGLCQTRTETSEESSQPFFHHSLSNAVQHASVLSAFSETLRPVKSLNLQPLLRGVEWEYRGLGAETRERAARHAPRRM